MKTHITVLIICMVFGIGILYSLYALSPFAAEIPRQSFERNFDPGVQLYKVNELDLKVNSFYIAGTAQKTLYLGNSTGPFHLVQVSLPSLDTLHMNINSDSIKLSDDYRVFRMSVDSPYFYLAHGVMPIVLKGLLSDRTPERFLPVVSPYFVDALPISPRLMVLKSFSLDTEENELATLKPDSPYFEFKSEPLQKQVDGIFCVDGTLDYSKELNLIIYVYAYRNEFVLMDTSLNVLKRHHTIDTFSTASIKVANVKSKSYRTLASPPARVNLSTTVSGDNLFVRSPLLAKNEDKLKFQRASGIDVYDIKSGRYKFSFYIDNYKGYSLLSFKVFNDKLAAIYDHYLVIYDLVLPQK